MIVEMENLRDILKSIDSYKLTEKEYGKQEYSSYLEGDDGTRCKICAGKGWLTPNVPTGHPDFGSIKACSCREEMREGEITKRLLAHSNLGYLHRYSFENLDEVGHGETSTDSELFLTAFRKASDFSVSPSGWLTITGPHGSGKTHLAASIANKCIGIGTPAYFIYVSDLLDHLRTNLSYQEDTESENISYQVRNIPVLVLDGLSNKSSTQWAQEKLIQILNHRANGKLPTVITTSDDISTLDPFIRSRLQDEDLGTIVQTAAAVKPSDSSELYGKVPKLFSNASFQKFDIRRPRLDPIALTTLKMALEVSENYAKTLEVEERNWLTFVSKNNNTGVGKTHLAAAIANDYIARSGKVCFADVTDLISVLREGSSRFSTVDSFTIMEQVKTTPLLILDGLVKESEWAQRRLLEIITYRQNHMMPTIVTTRIDLEKEAAEGSEIASRIQDSRLGQVFELDVPGYR
mgnify:FL=1